MYQQENFGEAEGTISCAPGEELTGCITKTCPQAKVNNACPVEEVCTNRSCVPAFTWYNI